MERLSKVLANAGVASRRGAEELISEGRVIVNGKAVLEQGTKVDPQRDHIKVDGRRIPASQPKMVIALNKPPGYVTTTNDPEDRPTVQQLVQRVPVRMFPVGRLDFDTEGLLLMTNDGELAQRLSHPSFGVEKSYVVKVKGRVAPSDAVWLARGVELEDGITAPAKAEVLRRMDRNTWLRLTIKEGRHHQVKRMCEVIGHPVIKLLRERYGPLRLGDLGRGKWRQLEPKEIERLRVAIKPAKVRQPSKGSPRGRKK
ncbi:MAG: pseudouridine synthase [Candidatus Alcyoniella australis]|nr:pseudouridine synthase [Candidatus Alcyoniella australis]